MNTKYYITSMFLKAFWILLGYVSANTMQQSWSSDISCLNADTNRVYLVVGDIQNTKLVKFPLRSQIVSSQQHGHEVKVDASPALNQFIFNQCDTYVITNQGAATRVEEQVVLLSDRFFKIESTNRHLFFAKKYSLPTGQELIDNHNSKNYLILNVIPEKRFALEEGTREFRRELLKYSITLPERNTAGTTGTVGTGIQPDAAATE